MSAGSLDLGTLHLKMKADKDGLRRDLKDGEREVEQSRGRMKRSLLETALDWARQLGQFFRGAGRDAADGFFRDADGRLRDHRGRFVAEGKKIGSALGEAASDGARTLVGLLGKLGNAAGGAGGGIGTLALVVGVLSAAMVFAIPLTYALGGALAALPAITTGGIAAVGVLAIGFMGLADAFKKTSSAGAPVADRTHQIMLAERRLTQAHEEELEAQLALNRAREAAAESLQQLGFSLRDARLDEADATDALTAAEKGLAAAEKIKDPKKRAEAVDAATRAHKRAELQLEMVRDRVKDLELQEERATKAGVEGSDEVQAALKRQKQATEQASDAVYELERAQKRTGGAASQETTKLARSAAAAVAAIKGLKDEWESLRLEVQERLFAGVGPEIEDLAAAWGPTLRQRLGGMATMFNGLFKEWAKTSKDPEFIQNISAGWLSVEQLIDRVGKAVAGPGLEAFGKLSAAAGPFLDMLGDKLAGVVEHFADWIDRAEKSGALQQFFDKATGFFSDIWDLGGDVIGLLGDFFSMWTDSANGDQAVSTFDAIRGGLHDLREWLKDPENREHLKEFIDGFVLLGTVAMAVLGWLFTTGIPKTWEALEFLNRQWDRATKAASEARDWILARWRELGDFFDHLPDRIGAAGGRMWDGLIAGGKSAFNSIAGLWNRSLGAITFTVPGWVPGVGGNSFGFPKIPMLEHGGLVKAVPGGRLVVMGEGGEDEIASPESQMRRIVAEELQRVLAGGVDGEPGGIHVEKLEVRAYSDRFSLRQVQQELSMHGVH